MLVPETRESKITSVKGKWFQYDWNTECEGGYENRGSLTKEPSSQVTAHKRLPAVSVATLPFMTFQKTGSRCSYIPSPHSKWVEDLLPLSPIVS